MPRSIPPKLNIQQLSQSSKSIRELIVFPIPAITEVAYLIARDIGTDAADLISSLSTTELALETRTSEDYTRAAELLRQYADANLDFVDALIGAIAERLNIEILLALDRRDFQPIRYEFAWQGCAEVESNTSFFVIQIRNVLANVHCSQLEQWNSAVQFDRNVNLWPELQVGIEGAAY